MDRREFMGISLVGGCLTFSGCEEKVIRPVRLTISENLPVKIDLKINDTSATDPKTVISIVAGEPVLVSGEMNPKPGVFFARSPKGFNVSPGLQFPPLPRDKGPYREPVIKPDDYHVFLLLGASYASSDPHTEVGAMGGLINQFVQADRKKLFFSGGLLGPKNPGTYALRLWGSLKKEREYTATDSRLTGETTTLFHELSLNVIAQA